MWKNGFSWDREDHPQQRSRRTGVVGPRRGGRFKLGSPRWSLFACSSLNSREVESKVHLRLGRYVAKNVFNYAMRNPQSATDKLFQLGLRPYGHWVTHLRVETFLFKLIEISLICAPIPQAGK